MSPNDSGRCRDTPVVLVARPHTGSRSRGARWWQAPILALVCACHGTLDVGRDHASSAVSTDVTSTPNGVDVPAPNPSKGEPVPAPVEAGVVSPSGPTASGDPSAMPEQMPTVALDAGGVSPDPAMDAGPELIETVLPVDRRNPLIVVNDHPVGNWLGPMALLAASTGLIDLRGIVVNTSDYGPDLERNRSGWQQMLDAASASGVRDVPTIVAGQSFPLSEPENGDVDATQANGSVGAQYIVDAANTLGTPELPLVVINGSMLTDVADAYLLDPSIAERIVVVAALGWGFDQGAVIGGPNGELDTWAGVVVAQRLRFVQVSAFYEQAEDVPDSRVAELPQNPLGEWMAANRGSITNPYAADHVALLAVALPQFILQAEQVGYVGRNPQGEALLEYAPEGCCWFVSEGDAAVATGFFWDLLTDPASFGG